MKVILGAGETTYPSWISTDDTELNLLVEESWQEFFGDNQADIFLAEHVWEHLTLAEGLEAAKRCYRYLKPGGYIRVAVPDLNFRDEAYQQLVQVGGPGPTDHPAADHKIVYDVTTLADVFRKAGFTVDLLEYCDEQGAFHFKAWQPAGGMIGRSFRYDTRNSLAILGMVSIIIDAHKPLVIERANPDEA